MSFFSFGLYFGLLSHCIRIHFEAHSKFKMFYYILEYDEAINGVRILLELCKVQLFIGIASCIHDSWFYSSDTYFIRQERLDNENLPYYNESATIEEDDT